MPRSLAAAQFAAEKVDAAYATARKAMDMAPDNEQNYMELAATFLLHDGDRAAEFIIGTGLEKLPQSARLHGLRGVVEASKGLDEAAARDFEQANRLDPAHDYGSAGLGVLYSGSDRRPEAIAILRGRLERSPDDATLNYLLAEALTRDAPEPGTPNFVEAEQALLRAASAKLDYVAAHDALGRLYARSGDDAWAVAELRLALRYDAMDRTALSQLAAVLHRTGRPEEAAKISR